MTENPLVSIMIPNFNHSMYLDECIKSALNQTYKNIEVVLLDNSSTDESIRIAEKYLFDIRFKICRNQFNLAVTSYSVLANDLTHGKYMLLLCADDFILPTFIECAVQIMEKHPSVGYVQGEKDFIYPNGSIQKYDSFYKCSFIAPGKNTMPIYMVTTVAHPSQGVIRRSAFRSINGYDKEIDHMNADRTLWFYLAYEYDVAYIREKMSRIRIGEQTETFITQRNFQHPILCHLTIKDYVRFAKYHDILEVYQRENEALERLSREFMIYAIGMISVEEFDVAQKYLSYAKVIYEKIVEEEIYKRVNEMIVTEKKDIEYMNRFRVSQEEKKRGYEPPIGYIELKAGKDYVKG